MVTPELDIQLIRSDDRTLDLVFTQSGSPYSIVGWTIFFTVKNSENDEDASAIVKKTVTSHQDAANGISAIVLTSADLTIAAGTFYYDIRAKTDLGKFVTILRGRCQIIQNITRRTS